MLELPELEALIAKRDRVADRLGARVSVTTPIQTLMERTKTLTLPLSPTTQNTDHTEWARVVQADRSLLRFRWCRSQARIDQLVEALSEELPRCVLVLWFVWCRMYIHTYNPPTPRLTLMLRSTTGSRRR